MNTILDSIFYGDYVPMQSADVNTPEIKNLFKLCSEQEDRFTDLLSPELKSEWRKLASRKANLSTYYEKEFFKAGVRFGVQLILEASSE